MARTVVGYIPSGFLNSAASATSSGSTDAETGATIQAGLVVGAFTEYGDSSASTFSTRGVVSVNLLTAGSGQTAGTYQVTANTGGAVMQYVVAAGGTVTAQPTVLLQGGPYTDAAIPTFTLPANGGTAATVQANIGLLYSGTYQWVQLDPAYSGANILPGQPLWYVESASGIQVTPTSAASNLYDWAGTSIDPNFGPSLPYAFIQVGPGKHRVLVGSQAGTVNTYGVTVDTSTGTANYVAVAVASLLPYSYMGMPLATIVAKSTGLARITRSLARF
jgi:hypothetical protein